MAYTFQMKNVNPQNQAAHLVPSWVMNKMHEARVRLEEPCKDLKGKTDHRETAAHLSTAVLEHDLSSVEQIQRLRKRMLEGWSEVDTRMCKR